MDKSKEAVKTYDKVAKKYAAAFQTPSEHLDVFLQTLPRKSKILDVGCGPGIDAQYMHQKGFHLVGVDLSKEMIRLAKKQCPEGSFTVHDIRTLTFPKNSFDGICVAYSLIHLPKKQVLPTLKKIYAFLQPKGALYVAVQAGVSQEVVLTEPLDPKLKLFVNVFSRAELKELLQEAGFTIIKTYRRKPKAAERAEFTFDKLFMIAKK